MIQLELVESGVVEFLVRSNFCIALLVSSVGSGVARIKWVKFKKWLRMVDWIEVLIDGLFGVGRHLRIRKGRPTHRCEGLR